MAWTSYVLPGGAKLQGGDHIASAAGYELIVPSPESPQFMKFYNEAKEYAGTSTGKHRVEKFVDFVHSSIEYDNDFAKGMKVVPLVAALRDRKGVCKEKAAALYMILEKEGFDAEYVKGTLYEGGTDYGHAWVRVKVEGVDYLADPTNNFLGRYGSTQNAHGLKDAAVTLFRLERE